MSTLQQIIERFEKEFAQMLENLKIADAVINRDGIIFEFSQHFISSEFKALIEGKIKIIEEDIEVTKEFLKKKESKGELSEKVMGYSAGRMSLANELIALLRKELEE